MAIQFLWTMTASVTLRQITDMQVCSQITLPNKGPIYWLLLIYSKLRWETPPTLGAVSSVIAMREVEELLRAERLQHCCFIAFIVSMYNFLVNQMLFSSTHTILNTACYLLVSKQIYNSNVYTTLLNIQGLKQLMPASASSH